MFLKIHKTFKGKAFIWFDFFKKNLRLRGGGEGRGGGVPPDLTSPLRCIFFRANMLIWIGIGN